MSAIGRYGNRVPTEREYRVIELVAEGLKNKEVAEAIGTTEHVVKNYLRVIYDKLGLWKYRKIKISCSAFVGGPGCLSGSLPRKKFRAFHLTGEDGSLELIEGSARKLASPSAQLAGQ